MLHRVILTEIRVHPYPNNPIPINTDHIIKNMEVTYCRVQLTETLQGTFQDVDTFLKGNISDIGQPDRDMLDPYLRMIGSSTKLPFILFSILNCIDNMLFS